ncbi:MAG: transglycosylase SLT domain-containing protein [Acidobacteria bacterium]|nr:transglycosylase SLT domain-containing protein [Acidobacteriota bacterium]
MKASIYKVLSLTAIFSSLLTSSLVAQVTSSRSSNDTSTAEVAKAQDAVRKILDESGNAFKEGIAAYVGDNRPLAGERFDRSIEVFLLSTVNIQREAKLQNCYNQLVETNYSIEFPTDHQLPQVRSLAMTCGWNIDNSISDSIALKAKAINAKPMGPVLPNTVASNATPDNRGPQVGFNSQEFEPSPLDELSKLELTQEEKQIDTNPVAQQQYQYIQQAVANKSLGFSFQVHPMIQQFINYYRGRGQKTMETGLYRSGMFMRMARRIFKEEGIPENVAWLGQVESAWKPVAMSHMAASGLWQFIPGTGDRYGLKRNAYVDERNSLDEATRASARYLKFLFNRYGNWELAMAGYNCGEGNVDKAIRRAGVANFWQAYPYLPKETRDYVPNILAVILVANNPSEYGFGHVRPAAPMQYDRIRVPASTNLNIVAQAADVNVQYIRFLNPHFRSNVTPPEPYIVNIPAGKANEVVALFRRIPASKISNTNLASSAAGETWQNISNRTGVSVADLMAANPGMAAPKGKVFVPVAGNNIQATSYSRPTNVPKAPTVSNVRIVKAKAGDTVAKIAARENLNAGEVAKFNGLLPNSVLGAGREIKVPTK